ncbi:hypothetical protein J6590_001808 [Homalodisca vitripennis]|nr:hypothetical protein J6590_001808 [Homalodisca vitripennis]
MDTVPGTRWRRDAEESQLGLMAEVVDGKISGLNQHSPRVTGERGTEEPPLF